MSRLTEINTSMNAVASGAATGKDRVSVREALRGRGACFGIFLVAMQIAPISCARAQQPLPTVAGPESTVMLSKVSGVIVTTEQSGHGLTRLEVIHLPSLERTSLTPITEGSDQIITGFSGPDETGTIVYIHSTLDNHYLKTIKSDGTKDQIIFERPGGFASTGVKDLAIAPTGGHVAFLSGVALSNGVQMQNPPSYLTMGRLEIWDINEKTAVDLPPITAVSSWSTPFLSWFPDGKKLAFVELVPKQQALISGADLKAFASAYPGWEKVPIVTLLDIQTGKKEEIHSGFAPVVSWDGTQILAQFTAQSMIAVDEVSKGSRPITLPGAHGFAFAIPKRDLFLYWGLPTAGAAPAYSPFGSFRAGLQMVSIKVADGHTGSFQTVVYPIDPRNSASFGRDQPSK